MAPAIWAWSAEDLSDKSWSSSHIFLSYLLLKNKQMVGNFINLKHNWYVEKSFFFLWKSL